MHFVVVTTPYFCPDEAPNVTYDHTADYLQAFTRYRQWESEIRPGGFVLLVEMEGKPDAQALRNLAHTVTPEDDAVIRSCLGSELAQQYASRNTSGVTLTAQDFASLNKQKYLLLRLLSGERLSREDLLSLDGLASFVDAVQDSANQQGVPAGVIWPNVPFGSGCEEERRLSLEHPELAG